MPIAGTAIETIRDEGVMRDRPSAATAEDKGRLAGLDGLRAVSVLIVFLSHYSPLVFPQYPILVRIFPGMFGVVMFFVISGLLICTLLMREYEESGTVSLQDFYIRRLLRLSPALIFYVAVFFLAYLIVDGQVDPLAFLSALTYTSNYYQSAVGSRLYDMPVWSLAVEEHFYLLFPLMLPLLLKRPKSSAIWVVGGVMLGILLWRCVLTAMGAADFEQVYRNSDTRLDAPLFGVALALLVWRQPQARLTRFIRSLPAFATGIALIVLSIVVRDDFFRMTIRYTIQGIGVLFVVGYLVFSPRRSAVACRAILDLALLRFVGNVSYSLYLWHLTLLMFFVRLYPDLSPGSAVAVGAASVACACASYYGIERPFIGLRRRFGSHSTA